MLDMKEYALEVVAFSAGRTVADVAADQMLRRAIERSMEVIGEAAELDDGSVTPASHEDVFEPLKKRFGCN
jgi:uncharacterized protein with HEPN domain